MPALFTNEAIPFPFLPSQQKGENSSLCDLCASSVAGGEIMLATVLYDLNNRLKHGPHIAMLLYPFNS